MLSRKHNNDDDDDNNMITETRYTTIHFVKMSEPTSEHHIN